MQAVLVAARGAGLEAEWVASQEQAWHHGINITSHLHGKLSQAPELTPLCDTRRMSAWCACC
jgi:uncharacterized NAD-dependent epimerase/dehydratase family protein